MAERNVIRIEIKQNTPKGRSLLSDVEETKRQIDSRVGATRISYASYTGVLERLNVHGSKWSFTIFPPIGPGRILCRFNADDIDFVKGLVKEVVTVKGRAVYGSKSSWPIMIRVESVKRKEPAPEGLWSDLSTKFREHWDSASEDDKTFLDLGAMGA